MGRLLKLLLLQELEYEEDELPAEGRHGGEIAAAAAGSRIGRGRIGSGLELIGFGSDKYPSREAKWRTKEEEEERR